MFDLLDHSTKLLEEALADFEPAVFDGDGAASLVERFTKLERLAATGKALAARRVADSGAWRRDGDRSPAHWMAKATGTSVGRAVGVLETAQRLSELPGTAEAARLGRLSEEQVREIASAAAASPVSENELLSAAASESLSGLKEKCAQVRAAALPDETERYERIRKRRSLRHWTDSDGTFRLDARLTPDAGASVLAALEPHRERIFADARKAGRRESYDAYAADALVAAVTSGVNVAASSEPKATVHVRVDHAALVRGSTEAGEVCEIPGVGPIAVATARALANDAYLCVLVTDGVDIRAVTSMKRTIPARLRRSVQERDRTCVVPGCDARHHLQIDHRLPREDGGPTELANLNLLCIWHHYLKTHRGYVLGGGPEAWTWSAPERGP